MEPTSLPVPWPGWLAGRVPTDRPFTYREARAEGLTDRRLASALRAGHLVSPVKGVFHATHLEDGLELRIACLRLVVPDDAVITDRTAGWLHGAPMILAPNDHLRVPPVSIFRSPGYRLRNSATASGERTFGVGDVVDIDGLRVTSKLRTTCDLGRLLHRDQAMAAMDSMMHVADFGLDVLVAQERRFRGQRGVCQFRELAPLADPRSQSPGESILKLRWRDCTTLPIPTPQLCVQRSRRSVLPGPRCRGPALRRGVRRCPVARPGAARARRAPSRLVGHEAGTGSSTSSSTRTSTAGGRTPRHG